MDRLIILPVLIPLFGGMVTLLLRSHVRAARAVSLVGALAGLAVAVALLAIVSDGSVLATQMGGWPAPYGITFVVDLFSAIMLTVATLLGATVLLYALGSIDVDRQRDGFYTLYQFLMMGVCGSFLTGDLFNMYVFFEVMLVSSFGLMVLGGERGQLEGGLKYVVINMVSTTLFVSALGILYGTTGTLNMAHLSERLAAAPPGLTSVLASMFIITFGIKAGVFPLFFWLPASYHTPPPAVSAIFAGLLTKVGVYAMIRVFTLVFLQDSGYTHGLILLIAGLTMVTGVLGAVAQNTFRRILSFHIISQIGYMIMGLGIFSPLALAGSVFFITHQIIVKTNLFLVSGVVERIGGTSELKRLGGLCRARPGVAALFLIPALSLAGLPPLSGFFGKFILVRAGLEEGQFAIVAVSLAVSLLTLLSMLKIWNEVFWKPVPTMSSALQSPQSDLQRPSWLMLTPALLLALVSIALGVGAEGLFTLALRAAEGLSDPGIYIQAVLGPG